MAFFDDDTELGFEDMLSMSDEEVDKLLGEYNAYKEERLKLQHLAFVKLPARPPLVLDAIHYLRTHNGFDIEGIFRVNGDSKSVDMIRNAYSDTVDTDDILRRLEQEETLNCFDVATALKSYFRLLESPLVPMANYQRMKDLVESTTVLQEQVVGIRQEIKNIPEPNLSILCYVMKFFREVIDNAQVNKMSANNMATCLTMSITRFTPTTGQTSHLMAMLEVGLSTKIIGIMLSEVDFNDYIKPKKYFELLNATNYRRDLIPKNYKQFKKSDYAALFPQLQGKPKVAPRANPVLQKKVPPAMPPRNKGPPPPVEDLEMSDI